jgi:hypothetical protein
MLHTYQIQVSSDLDDSCISKTGHVTHNIFVTPLVSLPLIFIEKYGFSFVFDKHFNSFSLHSNSN